MSRLWVTPEELEDVSGSPFAYEACKVASFVLWSFSGRRYNGVRTVTERYDCPCRSGGPLTIRETRSIGARAGAFSEPYMRGDGHVYNTNPCGCAGRHSRLRLRGRPVRSVQRVMSGDRELAKDEYQVVNHNMLQPAPGASFDTCGLEVTYTYGVDFPAAGRRAARHLAQQLAKGWAGDETCELPDRVTSVSRQGVSYTILDDQAFLDDLRTGIYSVDLFLRAVNPDKARKPAKVFSPDLPKASRVTANATPVVGPYDLALTPGKPYTWTVDITDINAGILMEPGWTPQAQISSWNGALLFETNPVVSGNTLTATFTGEETSRINIGAGGSGAWDVYALNADGYTIVHVLSSNVYSSAAAQTV